ncbi:MAG: N-acyl homoserine lactonase family protein [Deltaproteobacteria bacterium]|nr:N-acyl homoserine lactonase family protein [Deltaproteobacteria bacterium]
MAVPVYEIYALKYAGPLVWPACMVRWFQDLDRTTAIHYYLFAIRCEAETVVVDCGCTPALARARGLPGYVNPVQVLRRIDIDARKVENLIVSHIHFDHVGGISLFPGATVHVQEREYGFWMEDPMARRAPFLQATDPAANRYLRKLKGTQRLNLVRGERKMMPGIELVPAPGHTVGLQAVAVNTRRGTAVIKSDAAHVFSSYRTDIPSAIITDMIAWMKSYDRLRAKASSVDLLFPGHDPALLTEFPKVAEDVTRLA